MLTTTLPPQPMASRAATPRVQAIDVVRGLAMVIMALDHIREFWTPTAVRPEDVAHASALLFFTRWITHFCAPTFVFLAGTSVFLYQQKQPDRGRVSWFLLTRGLWLVFMEVVIINFFLQWGAYNVILLQVIWAIGWGMVALAGLIWLPRWLVATLALAVILGHNALPNIQPVTAATLLPALIYDSPFLYQLTPKLPVLAAYTILPWAAVLAAGYCIGPWFQLPLPARNRLLRLAGAGALLFFVVLRFSNWYGDPQPWAVQPRGMFYTALSFINVTKYPPSLLFLSLTLGVALLLLSVAEDVSGRLARWLSTFGKVPMFYYLLHFCLISGGALLWTWAAFGRPYNLSFAPPGAPQPAAYQPSLLRAYVVWAVVVVALYWPCRWYLGYKQRHAHWWLSYL
ncbi:putative membrane protein [Hymenobacter sp. UYAg731]